MSDSGASAYARGVIVASDRERDHFYPTPPRGTEALLSVETFPRHVWEPACGEGDISRVLAAAGHEVLSTDLIDRGFGQGGVDFLLDYQTRSPAIITNPPFYLAEDFALHAIARAESKVALLARLAWLEGAARHAKVFKPHPPSRVWVFSRRLGMKRGALAVDRGGLIAFAWFVWDRAHVGPTQLGWL